MAQLINANANANANASKQLQPTFTVRDLVSNPNINKLEHVVKYVTKHNLDYAVAKLEIARWAPYNKKELSKSNPLCMRLNKQCVVTPTRVKIIKIIKIIKNKTRKI